MVLSYEELERYSRQISIKQFGSEAQFRLKQAKVAVFGVGGVGCVAALYLAAAGVGNLILVDQDVVDVHNLNRQVIYHNGEIGRLKAELAVKHLKELNPFLKIMAVAQRVGQDDICSIVNKGCSFVIDAFDCVSDRLIINRSCIEGNVTAAHGFVQELSGEVIIVQPKVSPCLHCILDPEQEEPAQVPVLGTAAGVIGIQLANAAIKFLSGYGQVQAGYRMIWDLAFDQFMSFKIDHRPHCPVCGSHK
ncbi:MAG: HesA/MoeB/ThiF family protein [Bacillota bacterium]|jgi:molybdopterin/thiamine biosynthesis adenylyltransferase